MILESEKKSRIDKLFKLEEQKLNEENERKLIIEKNLRFNTMLVGKEEAIKKNKEDIRMEELNFMGEIRLLKKKIDDSFRKNNLKYNKINDNDFKYSSMIDEKLKERNLLKSKSKDVSNSKLKEKNYRKNNENHINISIRIKNTKKVNVDSNSENKNLSIFKSKISDAMNNQLNMEILKKEIEYLDKKQ